MPDEMSVVAESAMRLAQISGMTVPALFSCEVHNVLVVNERRGRLDKGLVESGLAQLATLPVQFDETFDSAALLALARAHRLAIYDAAYLALAKMLGTPLATLDKRLAEAARAEGVTLA